MTDRGTIRLEIPGSAKYVAVARNVVDSLSKRIPLTDEQLGDLKLAVGEACANAVKYSSPSASAVQILFDIQPDRIEVEVRNRGNGRSRWGRKPTLPPVERMQEGGMGMFLIDQLMDEMKVHSRCGTTRVRMAKRFG